MVGFIFAIGFLFILALVGFLFAWMVRLASSPKLGLTRGDQSTPST